MGATNETPNLKLSQFVQSDHATWYGDYNGDMLKIDDAYGRQSSISETLTEQVGTNTNDISAMKQNINGLQNGLNSTNVAVQQTQSRVTTLETEQGVTDNRLTNLEDDVSSLMSNDQWVIVGDSYGADTLNYMSTLISLNPNRTIHNVCVSGAGFTRLNNTFLQNLQNYITNITSIGAVSKVVVLGGWNDMSSTESDIKTAVKTFCQYVEATFTKARCYVGLLYGDGRKGSQNTVNVQKVVRAYESAENLNNATYLHGLELITHDYELIFNESTDNTHPGSQGYNYIAHILNSYLTTNIVPMLNYTQKTKSFTYDTSNVTSTQSTTVTEAMSAGSVFGNVTPIRFKLVENLNATNWLKIGTHDLIYSNPSIINIQNVVCYNLGTGGGTIDLTVQFRGTDLYISSSVTPLTTEMDLIFIIPFYIMNAFLC